MINEKDRIDQKQLILKQQKKKFNKHKETILNHGQVFGDEILLLKAGRLMQKFVESKRYTVTCISMGAKVLMFNVDDLLKLIDKVPSVMEDLKN
jgi:hypothetical protein